MQWSAKSFGSCWSGTRVGWQGAEETSEDTSTQSVSREGSGVSREGRGREEGQKKKKEGGFSGQDAPSRASPFPNSPFLLLSFDHCSLVAGLESGL